MTIPADSITVLAVEDDPTVLMVLEDDLADRGYSVVSARNSGEALHILGSEAYSVDVLIADIRLGSGIDGWEIARCAREIKPDLPIIYVTGDSYRDFDRESVSGGVVLKKPFSLIELAVRIRSLLAARGYTISEGTPLAKSTSEDAA
jgi:DNA-binding response OmpR family regulator